MEAAGANRKIFAVAEEALRLACTRYQARLTSLVELLTAESTTEEARANYARALYDSQAAKARLNAAVGFEP